MGALGATFLPLSPRARRRRQRGHPTDANGSLRTALASPAWAGLVSYAGGLITMIVAVIALGERVPSWKTAVDVPWYAWSGGVFGAAFILLAILLLPSLGAATLFALVIAGQVLAAVTLSFRR